MTGKVLVIDDEPVVRRVFRKKLQAMGLQVLEAEDGDRAIQVVRNEHPALVLLDIHMPRLDGIETLSSILDLDPHIQIVVVSGDSRQERAQLALERGAHYFLDKPVDLEVLEMLISTILADQTGKYYCRNAAQTGRHRG